MKHSIFVGFDGFIDETVDCVYKRLSATSYEPYSSLKQYGEAIAAASGKSGHFEWVTKETRIGGNAPLLATALLEQGVSVHFAGCCGDSQTINTTLFEPLATKTASFLSIEAPGYTQLIELTDGKIFFGKTASLFHVTQQRLVALRPEQEWIDIFHSVDAIAMVNWSMLPHMTEIWQWLGRLPLQQPRQQIGKIVFIDLADPKKRSKEDLLLALETLASLQEKFTVILGLNRSEAMLLCALYGLTWDEKLTTAQALRDACRLYGIIIHSKERVIGATAVAAVEEPVESISSPVRITGAGDHFNAGFLRKFVETQSLQLSILHAIWTAQEFIRTGISPSIY